MSIKVSKNSCEIVAADARVSKQYDETGRCRSGGVLIAIVCHLAGVIAQKVGVDVAEEENRGRIAEGGLYVFAINIWHTEGWSPRNEVLMETVQNCCLLYDSVACSG